MLTLQILETLARQNGSTIGIADNNQRAFAYGPNDKLWPLFYATRALGFMSFMGKDDLGIFLVVDLHNVNLLETTHA